MPHRILSTALGALAAIGALAALAAPSAAQDGTTDNVFFEARSNAENRPQLLFVFSDGAQSGLAPKDAFTVEVAADGTCAYNFDASADMGAEAQTAPVYGPGSDQKTINALRLPTFFASLAAERLIKKSLVSTQGEAVPYFNCTGYAWNLILSEPPQRPAQ